MFVSMLLASVWTSFANPLPHAGLFGAVTGTIVPLWGDKMPDRQSEQFAAPLADTKKTGFNADEHRMPYLYWYDAPVANKTDSCMILISGGGYANLCDGEWVERMVRYFTSRGIQCVSLWYRTPRPKGLPIYQSGWEDGQRAVRLVRSSAKARGFDPEKIGAMGFSAGGHLTLMLATSALTPAYAPVDELDNVPCHVNLAVPVFPAYVLSDGLDRSNVRKGDGPDITINPCFKFDAKTCPMCLMHGSDDVYSSMGSVMVYQKLHAMGISSDLHAYAGRAHGFMKANGLLRIMDRWQGVVGDFLIEKGFIK